MGDLVKLTKSAARKRANWDPKTTLAVIDLDGDGAEYMTMVTCRVIDSKGKPRLHELNRNELWFAGKNIFGNRPKVRLLQSVKPKNNDGRTICFMCEQPTKVVGLGTYNICANRFCEWFDN